MKQVYVIPIAFELEVEVETSANLKETEGMLPHLVNSLLSNLNISDETNDMFVDSLADWVSGDLTNWKFRLLEDGEDDDSNKVR